MNPDDINDNTNTIITINYREPLPPPPVESVTMTVPLSVLKLYAFMFSLTPSDFDDAVDPYCGTAHATFYRQATAVLREAVGQKELDRISAIISEYKMEHI